MHSACHVIVTLLPTAFFQRALSFVCQSLLVWSVWSGADPTKGLARSHISAIRHVTTRAGLQSFTPVTLVLSSLLIFFQIKSIAF